ncbi:MAG: TIGR00282 family metallophosphoesterase [Patescibacteria group bacterium]|nr:TIGR00282 family metallophosphoesterase [Patescibacteria group bacterium]
MNILFLGDIVARPGREAIALALPKLKKKYQPDITIANAENIAHGKGVTQNALEELREAGIDFFTSGNHVWKKQGRLLLQNKNIPLIRPANYPPDVIGRGYEIINILAQKIAVINLIGRTFFRNHYDCPFRKADEIITQIKNQNPTAVLIDFHSEATSEIKALGYYLDGRISALIGTHTHIQTADEQILPQKTAYISDAGMCGEKHSILGKNKEEVIQGFLKQDSVDSGWDNDWNECIVEGIFIKTAKNGLAQKIQRIQEQISR